MADPVSPAPAATPATPLVELYRQMLLIRRVEEAAAKAYASGRIGGFLHLIIGQEAVCVGAISTLRPTDYALATYREHGHFMAKSGATLESARSVLAELYGKATGASKGLGGSMHLFSKEHRFLGGYGIVGGHIPIATGPAFASKYRGGDDVILCFFGEGTVPQGAWHEGLHLAGLWKLPIVFICENNHYAMGTPLSRNFAVADITTRAQGYGLAHDRFRADDVETVRDRIAVAVERARTEKLPSLIEVETYRFRGHSMSDPANYRTKDEVDEWRNRDPLPLARQKLLAQGETEERLAAIESEIKTLVADAVRYAEESPPATPESAWENVYADPSIDPRRL